MGPRIADAVFVASAERLEALPAPAFVEVAFAGRSNVGKSSLINALVERSRLVRTSATPGCTRALNLFRVTLAEPAAVVDLVDLPGYGYAKRSKAERRAWGAQIEEFLERRAGLRAVVVIVDPRRGLGPEDEQLLAFLGATGARPILVATKLDKLPLAKRKPALAALGRAAGARVLGFSARTGEGREPLWRALLTAVGVGST